MDQTVQTVDVGYAGAVGSVEQTQPRSAQYLLAARLVDGAHGARRLGRHHDRCDGDARRRHEHDRLPGRRFAFMFAIEKTKNSAAGVPILLAFTFFMGLMLSRLLSFVLGFSNGAGLIMTAFAAPAWSSSAWPSSRR